MSALRDEVEERLRPLPVGDGLLRLPLSEEARGVVDLLVGELESLRAELEAVRSRRLARCPVCAGACTRKYADDSWDPCDHCNGAGVIFVDKEST